MRENKSVYIKPYTVTMKGCNFSSRLENVVDGDLNSKVSNEMKCIDITYI